jgi:hypothetical protein
MLQFMQPTRREDVVSCVCTLRSKCRLLRKPLRQSGDMLVNAVQGI